DGLAAERLRGRDGRDRPPRERGGRVLLPAQLPEGPPAPPGPDADLRPRGPDAAVLADLPGAVRRHQPPARGRQFLGGDRADGLDHRGEPGDGAPAPLGVRARGAHRPPADPVPDRQPVLRPDAEEPAHLRRGSHATAAGRRGGVLRARVPRDRGAGRGHVLSSEGGRTMETASQNRVGVYSWHFMPWPYLDADFDAKYESGWVTVPNSLFDPDKAR